MDMAELIRQQARLIILKALADQVDETLNSDFLALELQRFGIRKDRGWVHEELRWLDEMGALVSLPVGSLMVVTLSAKGARHLSREIAIEGVQRPSRPGA